MGLYSTVRGISRWWSVTIKSSPLFYFAPGMEQYTLVYSQNGISYNIPKQAFAYYSNSMATQALLLSSDVVKNPGPSQEKVASTNNLSGSKPTAAKCDHFQKTIRWKQKNISCANCMEYSHLKCVSEISVKQLQSQSKWLGHSGVSLSPQCWCTRFGDRTAINNFERDEVSTRREKTAFG